MLYVDDRIGAKELAPLFRPQSSVQLVRLDFADFAFVGNGPDGGCVMVGVERKQVNDVLQCIVDGRFAGHQLPGLRASYDSRWLLIEGRVRENHSTGLLEQWSPRTKTWYPAGGGQRRWTYREFEHWLMTMQIQGGMRLVMTHDIDETVRWIQNLYSWWTNKTWQEHTGLNVFDEPDRFAVARHKITLVARIAKELGKDKDGAGLGFRKAMVVAQHFRTPQELWDAPPERWAKIPGIGKKLSTRIWEELHGKPTVKHEKPRSVRQHRH